MEGKLTVILVVLLLLLLNIIITKKTLNININQVSK